MYTYIIMSNRNYLKILFNSVGDELRLQAIDTRGAL